MNLRTGKPITRNKVTPILLPAVVKEKVEEMALQQDIFTIKFTNTNIIELPNIDDVNGIKYKEKMYNNHSSNPPYIPPQTRSNTKLRANNDVDKNEIKDLLADKQEDNDDVTQNETF